jgi:hypothetical protein
LRNDISTTGKFTDVSAAAGIIQSSLSYGLGISVADMNGDGWDDIYMATTFTRMIIITLIKAMALLQKAVRSTSITTAALAWLMILPITTTMASGCNIGGYVAG